ncbi:MAG: gamma carbonic anhydrase family protein [Methanomassiliicoccales archaeon]|nr:MAG: gamma carbonic anhydrase family protein [Methanomassiliicoccales archaeon]
MAVYELDEKAPKIGKDTFIHETASVIGEVVIGDYSWVGPGASIRGDYGAIFIGDESCIEDNCVIHAKPDGDCRIGDHVTVGHGAILHGCTVQDWALIGMGAVIGQGAEIGEWAVIGEGAVVPQRKMIPGRKIAIGVPAKVVSDVKDEYIKKWTDYKSLYKDLARDVYPKTLKRKD